jgi:hypothetical protein
MHGCQAGGMRPWSTGEQDRDTAVPGRGSNLPWSKTAETCRNLSRADEPSGRLSAAAPAAAAPAAAAPAAAFVRDSDRIRNLLKLRI